MERNAKFLLDSLVSGENRTQTEFYGHHPDCRIGAVVGLLDKEFDVCPSKFYTWRKQFVMTGQFKRDKRGLWAENFLDNNEDLKIKLNHWCESRTICLNNIWRLHPQK